MNILRENKIIIALIVLVVAGIIIYSISSTDANNNLLSANSASTANNVDDRELLKLLTDMQTIRLDGRIFESTAYLSLQDFSRSIVPEPVGREDPFAPLEDTSVTISGGEDLSDQVLLR